MRVRALPIAPGLRIALTALLLAGRAFAADTPPPAPAAASDAEREAFCKDATAHRLPNAIADAAAVALGHGFRFDSFQCVPASSAGAPAAAGVAAIAASKTFRIQVMDDQNQALEIQVGASNAAEPVAAATWEWMCWTPATAATARNDVHGDDARTATP